MNKPSVAVDFEQPLPQADRARITTAIQSIGNHDGTRRREEALQDGCWPRRVGRVTVTRVIAGGRSGALVLDALCYSPGERYPFARVVVKVDHPWQIGREWAAYQKMPDWESPGLAKVHAVSSTIARGTTKTRTDMAIVYAHAADSGDPTVGPATTLENLISEAFEQVDSDARWKEVASAFDRLLPSAHEFYRKGSRRPEDDLTTLAVQNEDIGPDLDLEVTHRDEVRELYHHTRADVPIYYNSDLLRDSTRPFGSVGATDIRVTNQVQLAAEMTCRTHDPEKDDELIATAHGSSVRVAIASGGADIGNVSDFFGKSDVTISGKVTAIRAQRHAEVMEKCRGAVRFAGEAVRFEDESADPSLTIAHPYAALHPRLSEPASQQPGYTIHGDLHAGNVMIFNGSTLLIDFANVCRGRPLYTDLAWLEVHLLRLVIEPGLRQLNAAAPGGGDPALVSREIVRLCRLLAVASRFHGAGADDSAVDLSAVLAEQTPEFQRAFGLLWRIRAAAAGWASPCRGTPIGSRPWWAEYLVQLTVSACRTLKWNVADEDAPQTGGAQRPEAVRTAVCVAGVAAEWLDGTPSPLHLWPPGELRTVAAVLAGQLDAGKPRSLELLALLTDAFDSGLTDDPELTDDSGLTGAGQPDAGGVR